MTFVSRSQVTTWDASYSDEVRRHTYGEILKSDAVLLSWLLGMIINTLLELISGISTTVKLPLNQIEQS